MAHGLEHGEGVQLRPGIILWREREREHREINKQVKTSMLHKTSLWKTESRGARRKDGGQRGRGIALTQMRTPGTKSH